MDKKPIQRDEYHLAIREPEARCRPWPRRLHCRRRAQRAFVHWYAANEERFAIKLELLKRTDDFLEIGFCKFNRIVTAILARNEISIPVTWKDDCWDIIAGFETYPKRVAGGYVCRACPEDRRPVFPSREALWRAEVFEPFLKWVNDSLANAVAVSVSGTPDAMTRASLVIPRSGLSLTVWPT
jgi:hypothetical protein